MLTQSSSPAAAAGSSHVASHRRHPTRFDLKWTNMLARPHNCPLQSVWWRSYRVTKSLRSARWCGGGCGALHFIPPIDYNTSEEREEDNFTFDFLRGARPGLPGRATRCRLDFSFASTFSFSFAWRLSVPSGHHVSVCNNIMR